jgi:hypothetical protein
MGLFPKTIFCSLSEPMALFPSKAGTSLNTVKTAFGEFFCSNMASSLLLASLSIDIKIRFTVLTGDWLVITDLLGNLGF